ncbi:IS5 family transposase [Streptomyces sp. NPDC001546]|uniref:IS5 family transposase n=1 Tax=Streptomyces sp. NPDC001546 TaxID=3364585 RepID=UPI0036CDA385
MDGRRRPWRDHRQVVDGALWRLRTGAPWPDLPELYGPWQAVLVRFTRWEADGTWARRLKHVQVRNDAVGLCGPSPSTPRSTGFTSTPPARKKRRRGRGRTGSRSRGGLTTKVHLAVDGRGLSPSIVLTPGNANDTTAFGQVLDGIRVRRTDTRRPRTTSTRVLGDNAYSSPTRRPTASAEGASAVVHPRSRRRSTATATWLNDASHASSSSARSRPGSTSSPTATAPESSWPRWSSGSTNQQGDHWSDRAPGRGGGNGRSYAAPVYDRRWAPHAPGLRPSAVDDLYAAA